MNRNELARKIYNVSHLTGNFLLRSGQISNEYFDKYLFESAPRLLTEIAGHLSKLIPEGTEVLAGLEMGGIPIAIAMSIQSNMPVVFVEKRQRNMALVNLPKE